MGRTPTYGPEIEDIILKALETRPLRDVCRDKGMPSPAAVLEWRDSRPTFAERYARAREIAIQHLADELLTIADDGSNDWMERETASGTIVVLNQEHVQRSRLRVDTRKWLLSKLKPSLYGDRIEVAQEKETPKAAIPEWLQQQLKEAGSITLSPRSDGSTETFSIDSKGFQAPSVAGNPKRSATKLSSFPS